MNDAVMIEGAERRGGWLVSCDHASNHVPDWVCGGDLGVAPQDMARHIAYDVGAWGVSLALARLLDCPAIGAGFSRLVIDPNRGIEDPTLIMRLYDGTIIPGNRILDDQARRDMILRLYQPYHDAYSALAGRAQAIVAVHSFTPCLKGRPPRPWQVGVLHSPQDDRFAKALIAQLQREEGLCVGDNQPYNGHLPGDAIDRHALQPGRHNALIEVRNDLIATPRDQADWASRLARHLRAAARGVAGLEHLAGPV